MEKKIYDKGLEEDGQYEIGVESVNQGLIQAMAGIPGVEIDTEKSSLAFNNNTDLHQVIAAIVPHARIVFVKSSENDLENMLKGE